MATGTKPTAIRTKYRRALVIMVGAMYAAGALVFGAALLSEIAPTVSAVLLVGAGICVAVAFVMPALGYRILSNDGAVW